jgi:hypothetical protein
MASGVGGTILALPAGKLYAADLTWEDVDFRTNIIRVPATLTKSGRKLDLPMFLRLRHAGGGL